MYLQYECILVPFLFVFLPGYDVVVDCTDAPPSRYLLNDAALSAARPLVAASAVGLWWLNSVAAFTKSA